MTEQLIEYGLLILAALFSASIVISLFRDANKHERTTRTLDEEIEKKVVFQIKTG